MEILVLRFFFRQIVRIEPRRMVSCLSVRGEAGGVTPAFCHLIVGPNCQIYLSLTLGWPISSRTHCSFLGPTLFFPPPRHLLHKKKHWTSEKTQNLHHDQAAPPTALTRLRPPHEVTQDIPLQGDDNDPLSHLPDGGFDNWSTTDTARIVAMTWCDNNRLKSCIVAASASVWGVEDIFPAQLDAVYRLLHPVLPNHLAVIQQTGTGKMHITRMLGVKEHGIVLIFIPLLTLSADVM